MRRRTSAQAVRSRRFLLPHKMFGEQSDSCHSSDEEWEAASSASDSHRITDEPGSSAEGADPPQPAHPSAQTYRKHESYVPPAGHPTSFCNRTLIHPSFDAYYAAAAIRQNCQTPQMQSQREHGYSVNNAGFFYTDPLLPPGLRVYNCLSPAAYHSVFGAFRLVTPPPIMSAGTFIPDTGTSEYSPQQGVITADRTFIQEWTTHTPDVKVKLGQLTPAKPANTTTHLSAIPAKHANTITHLPAIPAKHANTTTHLPVIPAKHTNTTTHLLAIPAKHTNTTTHLLAIPAKHANTTTHLPAIPVNHANTTTHLPAIPVKHANTTTHLPAIPAKHANTTIHLPAIPAKHANTTTHLPAIPAKHGNTTTHLPAIPAKHANSTTHLLSDVAARSHSHLSGAAPSGRSHHLSGTAASGRSHSHLSGAAASGRSHSHLSGAAVSKRNSPQKTFASDLKYNKIHILTTSELDALTGLLMLSNGDPTGLCL
ncbi:histone deacetylase complex subunit SAP25 isoform X1 [Hyperolius riggenbachi]|uniref:histone deacetylase complex subunit SAP25 isoform X1 n=1 Tax=Hyperolius riggenbachi TaxID=752182 RepID=UPI0035A2CF1C